MKELFISGGTAVGKSHIVAQVTEWLGGRAAIFDPLAHPAKIPSLPLNPSACDLVVFDHAAWLKNGPAIYSEVRDWCITHNKSLWVVEQDRLWLEQKGYIFSSEICELHIERFRGYPEIMFKHGGDTHTCSFGEFVCLWLQQQMPVESA